MVALVVCSAVLVMSSLVTARRVRALGAAAAHADRAVAELRSLRLEVLASVPPRSLR